VYDYISSSALGVLCDTLVRRAGPDNMGRLNHAGVESTHDPSRPWQTTRRHCGRREPQTIFPSLVKVFVERLAENASEDLGDYWLVHRLRSLFVEAQPLMPGELEMLRADIQLRLPSCGFSDEKKALFTDKFERILAAASKVG